MRDDISQSMILIVEDDQGLRVLHRRCLEREGFLAVGVGSGAEALAWLEDHRADLLVLDFKLPDMTAEELVVALAKAETEVPFIVVTGHGDERIAVKMMKQGAKDYLMKDGHLLDLLPLVVSRIIEQMQQEQKLEHAQDALSKSEERYRTLIENAPVSIHEIDFEGRFVSINLAGLDMIGMKSEDQVCGLAYLDYVGSENRDHIGDLLERAREGDPASFEFRVTIQGIVRFLDSCFVPLKDNMGQVVKIMGVTQDITGLKTAEQDLVRTQRLRAAGELSAGISHNLNNILMGIIGPVQLLPMHTDDPVILREADDILKSALRARDLVHRLHMSTAGADEYDLSPVEIRGVVTDAIRETRPRWQDEAESRGLVIKVTAKLEDVLPIKGTESKLHDIVINLLLNAVDAMPNGGEITIETQMAGDDVLLICSDTGLGMGKKTKERIFEPFFTTKMNVGTGLGLSTVYNTVRQWGGAIGVDSEPNNGTIFTLRLPIWTEAKKTLEKTSEVRSARHGRILIVEDDENIIKFLSRFLSQHHDVDVANDGQQGLEHFVVGRYDVAIVDLGMPGLSGDKVAGEMHRIDPHLATILITGWELSDNDPRRTVFDFQLQKPLDDLHHMADTLAQAIELHDLRQGEEH
ncbi:MAG: response regulator [Candidatus Latescibacteria bacterium]|nr:response regulator [Candidatus Latescibacterota bacterium]